MTLQNPLCLLLALLLLTGCGAKVPAPAASAPAPVAVEAPSEPEKQTAPEKPAEPEPEPVPAPEPEPAPEAPDDGWKLLLVNADHPLPEDFTVTLKALRNGQQVDERIYPELQQMFDDARAAGIYPYINESFRTFERQQEIMDKYIAR
jgi:LAS superfamily LD-carboxypeptidase LdcB